MSSKAQEWLDKTSTARWSTEGEASRMGKSGYAPRKARLAEMVVKGRAIVEDLVERYEGSRQTVFDLTGFLQREKLKVSDLREALQRAQPYVIYAADELPGQRETEEDKNFIADVLRRTQ